MDLDQDYTDRMAATSGDEKLFLVALEFLRVELGVKEHEIPDRVITTS